MKKNFTSIRNTIRNCTLTPTKYDKTPNIKSKTMILGQMNCFDNWKEITKKSSYLKSILITDKKTDSDCKNIRNEKGLVRFNDS